MPLRTQSDGSTFEVETSSRREVRLSPKLRLSTGGGGGSDAAAAFAAVAAAVAGAVTLAAALVPPWWTSARAAGSAASSSPRGRSLCRLKPTISNQAAKRAACSSHREDNHGQSVVIKGNQGQSRAIKGNQGQSRAIKGTRDACLLEPSRGQLGP